LSGLFGNFFLSSVTAPAQLYHAPFESLSEIERLVAAFENGTLPRSDWTHRAHLTVATWYLAKHPVATAMPLIRNGILKLNAALGIVSDADHGYHETITRFYIGLIAHHLRTAGENVALVDVVNSLLAQRGQVGLPMEYYRRQLLMSREARARCVEPDLKPFEWGISDSPPGA
jgi:hypothetical protein